MTEDESKLLMALARWVARKEQDEIERMDINSAFLNELRRLMNAVNGGAPAQRELRRPEPQLFIGKGR